MVAETELRCAVVYRLESPAECPTILACFEEHMRFAKAAANVIRNIPAGNPPEAEGAKVGGFRIVQSSDRHQLIYGVNREGVCFCMISGDWYPSRFGILFLMELATEFTAKFGGYTDYARPSSLTRPSREMVERMCTKYKDPSKVDKVTKAVQNAKRARMHLESNFDKIRDQTGSYLEILAAKSGRLHEMATEAFKRKTKLKTPLAAVSEDKELVEATPTTVSVRATAASSTESGLGSDVDDHGYTQKPAREPAATQWYRVKRRQTDAEEGKANLTQEAKGDFFRAHGAALRKKRMSATYKKTPSFKRLDAASQHLTATTVLSQESLDETEIEISQGDESNDNTEELEPCSQDKVSQCLDDKQDVPAQLDEGLSGKQQMESSKATQAEESEVSSSMLHQTCLSEWITRQTQSAKCKGIMHVHDGNDSLSLCPSAVASTGSDTTSLADDTSSEGSAYFDCVSNMSSQYFDLDGSFGDFVAFVDVPALFPYHVPSGTSVHWHRLSGSTFATAQSHQPLDESMRSAQTHHSNMSEWRALEAQFHPIQQHTQSPSQASGHSRGINLSPEVSDLDVSNQHGGEPRRVSVPLDRYEYLLKKVNELSEANDMLTENFMTMQEKCSDMMYSNSKDTDTANATSVPRQTEEAPRKGASKRRSSSGKSERRRSSASTSDNRSNKRPSSRRSERRRSTSSRKMRGSPESQSVNYSDEPQESTGAAKRPVGSKTTTHTKSEMDAAITLQCFWRTHLAKKRAGRRKARRSSTKSSRRDSRQQSSKHRSTHRNSSGNERRKREANSRSPRNGRRQSHCPRPSTSQFCV